MRGEKNKSLDIEHIYGHGSQRGSMLGVTVLAGCRQQAIALLCSTLSEVRRRSEVLRHRSLRKKPKAN
jgi:hypothetical protein